MRSRVENRIRLTLSEPPAGARGDEARGKVYVASLLVFLELLEAAREVDPIARPLPLYYAVSQAGRAIVAAHGDQKQVRGHGLAEGEAREPLTLTTVAPQTRPGLFGAAADAMGATPLTAPVELGALWAALPDLADTPHRDGRWAPALSVWPAEPATPGGPVNGLVAFPDYVATDAHADLAGYLARYPHARDAEVAGAPGSLPADSVTTETPRGPGVAFAFRALPANLDGTLSHVSFTSQVPEHRFAGEHWLVPSMGDVFLPPLLLWWALLFGLASLARNEPAVWRAALDVEAPLGVPLRELLDEAIEATPHWILRALTREEIRTRRPRS